MTGILILPPGDLLMGVEKQLKYSWRGRNLRCMTLENLMNEHMEDMKECVLSVVIPLDVLRIITEVMSVGKSTLTRKSTSKYLRQHRSFQIVWKTKLEFFDSDRSPRRGNVVCACVCVSLSSINEF